MTEIRTLSQLLDALKHGYIVRRGNQYAAHSLGKEERHFCVSIAEHVIEINSLHKDIYSLCKEFLCEDKPEIKINICQEDIDFEREAAKSVVTPQNDGYLETLAIYRKICTAMLEYDTFLIHGAAIAYKQQAYLFTAKSGTGKTTHIKKWLENLEGSHVVNGDKPLIQIKGNEVIICGTPWNGKEKMGENSMSPLRAIIFMERGEKNTINEISFSEAFVFLLQQTHLPDRAENTKKTLHLIYQLNNKIRFYKFIFNNMKEDAFSTAYAALIGERR